MKKRACALSAAALGLLVSCSPEVEPLRDVRSARGTLGEEVYKVLCRRMAGLTLDDPSGARSEGLCLGSAVEVDAALAELGSRLPARLARLAELRAPLAAAVDRIFPEGEADALELLMRELLPFYDAPEERVQNATRALATVLRALGGDPEALAGAALLGREGMTSAEGTLGLARAALGSAGLHALLTDVVPLLAGSGDVAAGVDTLLTGAALELATTSTDSAPEADGVRLEALLRRSVDVATGAPWLVARRDARGLPMPAARAGERVPFPFVDRDADGLADAVNGVFTLMGESTVPTPFAVTNADDSLRDARGVAVAADGTPLYETHDARATVLGTMLPVAQKLFAPDTAIAQQFAPIVPALFGARVRTERAYGRGSFAYDAPPPDGSPVVDLAHGLVSTVGDPGFDEALALAELLLVAEEPTWVASLVPWLALERRTREGADAYPDAALAEGSTFWDELFSELERASRQRRSAQGETALAALLRGALGFARDPDAPAGPLVRVLAPERLRHQGAVLAALMRFKDEWRINPKGESKRGPDEDVIRGAFRTPVDRTAPDAPVTCGKDGCGGPLAGSPFEDWLRSTSQQKCLLGNDGRSGTDCGGAANQSLMQRSLGLIAEMAGRSQRNKRITVGDLLDFAVLTDPCQNLSSQVTCEGDDASARDAYCGAQLGSASDFACDAARNVCIARRGSATCEALLDARDRERAETIALAEEAVAGDYTCPDAEPLAACHAYDDVYPAAFVVEAGGEAAIQEGHLLSLDDVGRTFGRALTHTFAIEIPNPWVARYLEDVARAANETLPVCAPGDIDDPHATPHRNSDGAECVPDAARLSRDVYEDMPASVDTLGELIEFLLDDSTLFGSDEDTRALRPDVIALSHVLFAPPGSSSFIVFDPLLVAHAPAACSAAAPGTPACVMNQGKLDAAGACCLESLAKPPLRYRLDTYYGATTFAWEHAFQFDDGTSLSFLASMVAMADAVNRTDFDADAGDDPQAFESTDYLFSTLGKRIAEHYDSPRNPLAQAASPDGMHYRKLSNLVSYEPMLADALDDGSVTGDPKVDPVPFAGQGHALGAIERALPLFELLDQTTLPSGRDGLDVSANVAELSLNPHATCAPRGGDRRVLAGQGACDLYLAGEPGFLPPPSTRRGETVRCWRDGTCFDQPGARRFLSPLYLALDALRAIDGRIAGDPAKERARDLGFGGLLDAYLANDGMQLDDRRLPPLALALVGYTRTRWGEEEAAGRLASYGRALSDDVADLTSNPVLAGSLRALEGLVATKGAVAGAAAFAHGALDDDGARALATALDDLLELTPARTDTARALAVLATALAPDVDAVLTGASAGSPRTGMVYRQLTLMGELALRDDERVLDRVLSRAVGVEDGRPSPLAELLHVLTAVEREDPRSTSALTAADVAAVARSMAELLEDDDKGFERLYRIVQCRSGGEGCE